MSIIGNDVRRLIEALERAAKGEFVSEAQVRSLRFGSSTATIQKLANESWRRLLHFLDDRDVRMRDTSYDAQMKQEMSWRAQELADLTSSEGRPRE